VNEAIGGLFLHASVFSSRGQRTCDGGGVCLCFSSAGVMWADDEWQVCMVSRLLWWPKAKWMMESLQLQAEEQCEVIYIFVL